MQPFTTGCRATSVVRVGRRVVFDISRVRAAREDAGIIICRWPWHRTRSAGRVRAAVHDQRGAAAVVRVRRRVVFDIGRVRAAREDAGIIICVGRGIVVVRSRIRAALNGTEVGIPKTPNRESISGIVVVPEDDWTEVEQVPGPSTAATGRRTPPVAVVAGIVEVAIVVAAVAARKGRKPKVVRAVAIVGPACCRFQGCPLSATVAVGTQVCLQCRPLAIGRDMPTRRTQAPSIVYRIPVVQTAIRRQRLRFVARVDVRTVVVQSLLPSP